MVARVVDYLGVPMGQNLPINYEDPDFNIDKMSEEIKSDRDLMDRSLFNAIYHRNQRHKVWGWKFPRASSYLPRILKFVRNPHLICVMRDPVCSSLRPLGRRNRSGQPKRNTSALRLMKQHLRRQQQNIDLIIHSECPAFVCSYEKAIGCPEQFVQELAGFIGKDLDDCRLKAALEQIKPGGYIQG
jgi:hypothetical protein